MAHIESTTPLEEQDIIDLYNDFHNLRDFVEELTGILYDNDELPEIIKDQISTLYQKNLFNHGKQAQRLPTG